VTELEIESRELLNITNKKLYDAIISKSTWYEQHNENWLLYQNDYSADDAKKDSWQARGYIPYLTDMVDRMVGTILEGYLGVERKLFTVNCETVRAAAMVALVTQELAQNSFDEMLDECVLEALLSGYTVIKDTWNFERGQMELHVVDPLDFYRVPDSRDGYLTIEAVTMERGELERLKEEGYEPELIDEAVKAARSGGTADGDRVQVEEQKRRQQHLTLKRYASLQDPVVLYDCWGRLYNEQGERVGDPAEDPILNWVICNDVVIKPPEKSASWDGGPPYSFGYIKRVQSAPYPASVVRDHCVLQRSMTRLINLVADKVTKRRAQWLAVRGQISKAEIQGGIQEGKIWTQLHPGPDALRCVSANLPLDGEFQLLNQVEKGMMMMGMTDAAMGQPTVRGREPLGTSRIRLGASMAFLGTIARRLERSLIRDVIRRTIVNMLQYKLDGPQGSNSNPRYAVNVEQFLGRDRLAQSKLAADDEQRKAMLERDFAEVRVRGLSDQISKQDKAVGMNYFLRMVTQLAQADPSVLAMVKIPGIVYDAAEMTGFEPDHVLTPEALALVAESDAGAAEATMTDESVPAPGVAEYGSRPTMAGGNEQAAPKGIYD